MPNQFILTDAGLYAASLATPTGPYIQIVAFKLGDDFATAPLPTNTALVGNTVYNGVPASFSYYDSKTIQINLEVPAEVGPFDYGELGLYLPGDVLFARFSYGVLRTKQTSISSGYANVLRIKALITLAQGPAVFNINPGTQQTTLEVANFSLVNTPLDNPENPLAIVHEPNNFQESTLLYRTDQTLWNLVNYVKIGTAGITGTSDATHIDSTYFANLYQPVSGSLGKYVIQTAGGYLRTISGISGNRAMLAHPIDTSSLLGQNISVYELDTMLLNELATSISSVKLTIANLDLYLGLAILNNANYAVSTGSTNPPPEIFSITFNAANPANSKLYVNGNGPYPLLDTFGDLLPVGLISAGETRTVIFANDTCVVQAQPVQGFPDGTRMAFNQSFAPPGWIKDTNAYLNDSIMRLVTSSVNTGGAANFSNWNALTSVGPDVNYAGSPGVGVSTGAVQHTHSIVNNVKYNDFIIAVRGNSIPSALAPDTNFSASVLSGVAPLSVTFTDLSSRSPTNWAWDFNNDGIIDSVQQNPVYVFTTPGLYSIALTATNAQGSTLKKVNAMITVGDSNPPVSNFSAMPVIGAPPLEVTFSNLTTGLATSYLWDFGDGTVSTDPNP